MTKHPQLDQPELDWRKGEGPVSVRFGDIYFSPQDGLAETIHVFLKGTDLPEAWAGRRRFVIGETGFGTGLNFLATWDLWRRTRPSGGYLHFVSAEAFPLSAEDLARAHGAWPQFAEMSRALRARWAGPLPGFHRLHLDDGVSLTLLHGEATSMFRELEAEVDAWFLDGFAPARNPEMWSTDLFTELARLSCPGARLATFTVAGQVRRDLAAAGFEAEKAPGFGTKRDMLTGRFAGSAEKAYPTPWFAPPRPVSDPGRVAVIGAGIAGASAAAAFARRGITATVFDRHGRMAAEASGNPIGLFMPRLTVDDTLAGRFHTAAFANGLRLMADVPEGAFDRPKGLIQMARDENELKRFQALIRGRALPRPWLRFVSRKEASSLAGISIPRPSLFFPAGGAIDPVAWARHLMPIDAEIRKALARPETRNGAWLLDGSVFDLVVLANGMGASLAPGGAVLYLRASEGQMTFSQMAQNVRPSTAVTFGGYVASFGARSVAFGSTYDSLEGWSEDSLPFPTPQRHETILALTADYLPELAYAVDRSTLDGRAAIRATTPDHMPIAGAMPDFSFFSDAYGSLARGKLHAHYPLAEYHQNLQCLTGLGSRGLVTAPLLGELLVSQICGDPWPLERCLAEAVHPARNYIRKLKRMPARHR